jgi:hypothetical protein
MGVESGEKDVDGTGTHTNRELLHNKLQFQGVYQMYLPLATTIRELALRGRQTWGHDKGVGAQQDRESLCLVCGGFVICN